MLGDGFGNCPIDSKYESMVRLNFQNTIDDLNSRFNNYYPGKGDYNVCQEY